MAGKRFKDFDAYWSEQKKEPVTFKAFGKVYTLPAAMPASIMLYTLRAKQAGEVEVSPETVIMMAEGLLGTKALDQLVADGLDVEQLGDMIKSVVAMYNGGGDEEETPTPALVQETGA